MRDQTFSASTLPRLVRGISAALALLLAASPSLASGAAQRMGIARGSYSLAAGASETVSSFCFDETRSSPSDSDTFDQVLSGADAAIVRVGTRSMSLQQAIEQHLVRITGRNMQLSELLGDPANRRLWNRLDPLEQATLAVSLRRHPGDFTHLQLENLSHQPVQITFGSTSILGNRTDVALPVPVATINPGISHDEQQHQIWKRTMARTAALLQSAGYAVRPGHADADGVEPVLKVFQSDHGLPPIGQLDAPTEESLRQAAAEMLRLRAINENLARDYTVMFVSPYAGEGDALYRVSNGRGGYYAVSSIGDVVDHAYPTGTNGRARQIVLVPRGMDQQHMMLLSTSASTYSRSDDAKTDVGVLDVNRLSDDVMLNHVDSIQRVGDVATIGVETNRAYAQTVDFRDRAGQSRRVRFVAKTRELLDKFLANLTAIFSRTRLEGPKPLTPLQLIAVALEQTRKDEKMTHSEFSAALQAEAGGMNFAEAARPFAREQRG